MACQSSGTEGLRGCKMVSSFRVRHYRFPADWRIPRHEHALPSLVVPLAGGFAGQARRETFACRLGDLLAVPPAAPHAERIGSRGAAALLIDVLDEHPDRLGGLPLFERFASFRGPDVRQLMDKVVREFRAQDPLSEIGLESALLELIVGAMRQPIPADDCRAGWLIEVREALDRDFGRSLDVAHLARRAGISRTHLTRSFRRAYGCSIGEYVRRRRLDRATELLKISDLPLADVALACGFYDQSHLCRHFRRHLGTTPAAWRAERPG